MVRSYASLLFRNSGRSIKPFTINDFQLNTIIVTLVEICYIIILPTGFCYVLFPNVGRQNKIGRRVCQKVTDLLSVCCSCYM